MTSDPDIKSGNDDDPLLSQPPYSDSHTQRDEGAQRESGTDDDSKHKNWWSRHEFSKMYPELPAISQVIKAMIRSADPGGLYAEIYTERGPKKAAAAIISPLLSPEFLSRLGPIMDKAKEDLRPYIDGMAPLIQEQGHKAKWIRNFHGMLLSEAWISLSGQKIELKDKGREPSYLRKFRARIQGKCLITPGKRVRSSTPERRVKKQRREPAIASLE
ncbi:hypothetical protein F4778DRAFT_730746 [Xylariomycetidae sp. FL2044]|nr:hypothetical protein F4778DRAFT_730746 [Xylariomycetidae sp. FL2044]